MILGVKPATSGGASDMLMRYREVLLCDGDTIDIPCGAEHIQVIAVAHGGSYISWLEPVQPVYTECPPYGFAFGGDL